MKKFVSWIAIAVLFAGCGDDPESRARSAVLITVDTWRADRFGAGGHPHVHTPHIDRFFRQARQFAAAYSPVPTTLSSHTSMLSGEWPRGHGVPRNGWIVPDAVHTIPEILGDLGFATAAFVSSVALDPSMSLDQGFDVYDASTTQEVARDQDWRPASETVAKALDWWASHEKDRRFLWTHVFEPHFPYDPTPGDFGRYDTGYRGIADGSMNFLYAMWDDSRLFRPETKRHLESLYHAEISGLDRELGRMFRTLALEGETLVIVTADHGESLGEHGLNFKHGPYVFPADVHVPFAVRGAAPFEPTVRGGLVRTIDCFATILAALGVEPPENDSVDLSEQEDVLVYGEGSQPWNWEVEGRYPNDLKQHVVRDEEWALVVTPGQRTKLWFDRRADPYELRPVAEPPAEVRERLEKLLEEWRAQPTLRTSPTTLDPGLRERLEAIGYVSGNDP